MYKVAGSSNSNRSLTSLSDSEDTTLTSAERLARQDEAALALAVAQIEEMELIEQSSNDVGLENEFEVVTAKPLKVKKEIKKVKKPSAPALDGWGSAFQAVGIGAPVKKAATGLSLAKPVKKSTAATSAPKVSNTGTAAAPVTTSRSFDDLKQIGRYQRDLEEQQQLQLNGAIQHLAKKSQSERKEASFCVDDFPVLGVTGRSGSAPHPHSSANSNNNGSSGVESVGTGSASALSVEQRNENIRAFVQEARMKKALNSPPLDIDLYDSDPYTYDDGSHGGSNYFDGVNSNYNSSSSRENENEIEKEKGKGKGSGTEKITARVGNWTKMGGVSAAPAPPSTADNDFEFDYSQAPVPTFRNAPPISFSDSDYPSLGPGPPKKESNGTGNGKYTAAALASGVSRPLKSAADLLLAKKEKTNKKLGNLAQDIGVGKA